MAGYDPKRPRPAADGDEPAPVEALLDPEATPLEEAAPASGPEAAPEPEVSPASDPAAAADPVTEAPVDAAPDDVSVPPVSEPEPSPHLEVVSATGSPTPAERHLRPVPNGASEVPVVDRPAEPTANRAVALVVAVGAAAAVVLFVVIRRRRRRD